MKIMIEVRQGWMNSDFRHISCSYSFIHSVFFQEYRGLNTMLKATIEVRAERNHGSFPAYVFFVTGAYNAMHMTPYLLFIQTYLVSR